eukprot:1195204-Prorocentrum_minimum.AAC.6
MSSSRRLTAEVKRKLSLVGTHSGMAIPPPALFAKNSKASPMASLISLKLSSPSTVVPNRALTTIVRDRSLKSAYTSRTPPSCHRSSMSCFAAPAIASAYESTAAFRKAGLESRRCRCQTAPSLTRRPLPAMLLLGKNAVPSF